MKVVLMVLVFIFSMAKAEMPNRMGEAREADPEVQDEKEFKELTDLSKETKKDILKQLTDIEAKKAGRWLKGLFPGKDDEKPLVTGFELPVAKDGFTRNIRLVESKKGKIYFTTSKSIMLPDGGGETQPEQYVYSIDKDLNIKFVKELDLPKAEPGVPHGHIEPGHMVHGL